MRNGIFGAALGAIVAGLIAFLAWGDKGSDGAPRFQKPRNAVITLTQDPTPGAPAGTCVGAIDVPNMGGWPGENLKWCVVDGEGEDQTNQCRPSGAWAVWLVFEGNRSPFERPNETRRVRIGRGCKIPRIADDARVGDYFTYKVHLQPNLGDEYEIVDPDIEIEPPFR